MSDARSFKNLLEALAQQHESEIEEAVRRVRADLRQEAGPKAPKDGCTPFSNTDLEETKDNRTALPVPLPNSLPEHVMETLQPEKLPRMPNHGSESGSSGNHAEPTAIQKQVTQQANQRKGQGSVSIAQINANKLADPEPTDKVSKFVQSSKFDQLSAALLSVNAIFIGVQVEFEFQSETPLALSVIDWTFCVLFLTELGLRLWGYGCCRFWCAPADRAWNIFDFSIVMCSTVDAVIGISGTADSPLGNVSVLRVIRVVRIVRVLRIIRVMKFFQDLRILLAAIVSTIKTASFALILIVFIMYMFAIAITQLVAEFVKEHQTLNTTPKNEEDLMFFFGGVFPSIFALFMTIAGGIDWKDAAVPLFEVGPLAISFFLMYTSLMVLCIMNVLLGIFCQCALDTAASDKENVIHMQLEDKRRYVDTLKELFASWDDNGDNKCSLQEFMAHISDETTQALLRSLEIETRDATTLFGMLDADGSGQVDLDEFVTGCITLRGGAKAVHMEKLTMFNETFQKQLEVLNARLAMLDQKL